MRSPIIFFVNLLNPTVEGRNPAPVDMVNIPLFTGYIDNTSQVVSQNFFHQQYHCFLPKLYPWDFPRRVAAILFLGQDGKDEVPSASARPPLPGDG